MRSASTTLASDNGPTLVDKIHVVVLVYALASTAVAVVSRLHLERGGKLDAVRRESGRLCLLLTLLFAAANALLIAQAAAG